MILTIWGKTGSKIKPIMKAVNSNRWIAAGANNPTNFTVSLIENLCWIHKSVNDLDKR